MEKSTKDFEIPDFFKHPRKARLIFFILNLIKDKPMHGYEIMKKIEEITFHRIRPTHAVIYTALNELADQGFINFEKEGAQKKIYSLTKKGYQLIDGFRSEMDTLLHSLFRALILGEEDLSNFPIPPLDYILNTENAPILARYSKEEQKRILLSFKKILEEKIKKIEDILKKKHSLDS